MYLVLAAYIAAGICGIQAKEKLVWEDCRGFLYKMNQDEKIAKGIVTQLPTGLEEALRLLKFDYFALDSILEEEVLEHYILVKEAEQLELSKLSEADRRALYFKEF